MKQLIVCVSLCSIIMQLYASDKEVTAVMKEKSDKPFLFIL